MRAEILKRLERLEREKALKSARIEFRVCSSDKELKALQKKKDNNITYVVLKL